MRYILACVLGSPIREYHGALVDEMAHRVGLDWTRRQAVPAHFTLKYWFAAADPDALDAVLGEVARTHRSAPVEVGGLGHFHRGVIFAEVTLSDGARRLVADLLSALRPLPWMSWDAHDADGLHPHVTLAEKCGARFDAAWQLARSRDRRFAAALDNVTVFEQEAETPGGIPLCSIRRVFPLR